MKIIGFSAGVVSRDSNIDRMVKAIMEKSSYDYEFIKLNDLTYSSCKGCVWLCAKPEICKLEDDLFPYVQKIKDAIWYEMLGEKFVYYTFAGAVENNILQILFEEKDIHCDTFSKAEGVSLIADEPLDFSCLPSDSGEIADNISRRWRHFTSWTYSGPYYEYLPPKLKKSETISQVAIPAVIDKIKNFQNKPLGQVNLRLFD